VTDHRQAIAARFAELSGRPLESMQEHVQYFKTDAFNDDAGELDLNGVDEYARRMITAAGPPPLDPVRSSISRSRPAGLRAGDGASLSDRRAEAAKGPRRSRSTPDDLYASLALRGGRHQYTDEGER
jgi:hypothetical protein